MTRISGEGHILLVLPAEHGGMNAWCPLLTDPTPRGGTFEDFYECTFLADAYRTNEWSAVPEQRLWTPTDSIILQPSASVIYGLRVRLLRSVRDFESELVQIQRLVVKVVPGYVVGVDMTTVSLYVLPGQYTITEISMSNKTIMDVSNTWTVLASGWHEHQLYPHVYGRVRVTIHYRDETSFEYRQTVSMFVLPSFRAHVRAFGQSTAKNQWYVDPTDPFDRIQSFLNYKKIVRLLSVSVMIQSRCWSKTRLCCQKSPCS